MLTPPPPAFAHLRPVVSPESAVKTWSLLPTESACGLPEPSPIKIFPLVDKSTAVTADVPLPINTPLAVKLVAPVPPLPTISVADSPAAVPLVFWFPAEFTPAKSMFAVPSKDTPPIFRAVAKAVAVAAFPVVEPDVPLTFPVTFPVMFPAKVPDNTSVLELKVNPLADLGAKSPVAAVTNKGKQVVSLLSSATVTFVEVVAVAELPVQEPELPDAFPVTLPVMFPENVPAKTSVLELKVKPLAVLGPKSPVAAVTNKGKQVVSEDSSATVIAVGVVVK